MKSLKKIVFKLMEEKGHCIDQDVFNLYELDKEINFNTIENYKTQYMRLKILGELEK